MLSGEFRSGVLPMDVDYLLAIVLRTIGAARGRAARGSPG